MPNDAVLAEIEKREKGPFDLSFGTSIAIQKACGFDEDGNLKTRKPPILEFDELLVNLRTLFRNIYTLLDRDIRLRVETETMMMVMVTEMKIIEGIINHYSGGRTRVRYYTCTYDSLTKEFPNAYFRDVNTQLQKIYAHNENQVLEKLHKQYEKPKDDTIAFHDVRLPGKDRKTLIVTNYTFDLLWWRRFEDLQLLESYTGDIKKRVRWYTKLKNGNKLPNIPFDRMTVQLFGDSGDLLKPYPKDYRDTLLKVAKRYKWDALTSQARVKLTVDLYKDYYLKKVVHLLYK